MDLKLIRVIDIEFLENHRGFLMKLSYKDFIKRRFHSDFLIQIAYSNTPVATNVQHLKSPKKCCTLKILLHIGDIDLEKFDFLKKF